jgi:sugar/nucleoside kinase (ribokinase family)
MATPVPGTTTWPATVVIGSETQYNVGPAGMFEAVRSVSGERLKWVVVTRGSHGADAYAASSQLHVDAVAADQIDATGAGDAFTVGLLHGLLHGDDMGKALQVGAAWGAAEVRQLRSIPVPWEELADPFH